jgi:hypothetical protein
MQRRAKQTHLNHVLDGDVAEGRAELLVVARQPTDHVELGDDREYALPLVVLGHHRPAPHPLLAKPFTTPLSSANDSTLCGNKNVEALLEKEETSGLWGVGVPARTERREASSTMGSRGWFLAMSRADCSDNNIPNCVEWQRFSWFDESSKMKMK